MKSHGVHRSVRAQRYSRSAGDAPNLGRVTRVVRGGPPPEPQRKRRRSSQEGHPSRDKKHPRRVLVVWSTALFLCALGVLGAFLLYWLKGEMGRRKAVVAEDLQPVSKHNVSRFASPSEQEAKDLVKRGLAIRDPAEVERYFRPGFVAPEAVIAFLKEMEAVDGLVTGYQWLSSMDANDLLLDGVLVSTIKDGKPRNRIALLTPDDKGGWRMDFDAFARTVKPSWNELLGEAGGQGLVRVIVARDSYFNGPFADELQWLSYGMASPDSQSILLGYCRKDSPQARAMERILGEDAGEAALDGDDRKQRRLSRAILELKRPAGAEARQFEITRVLAEDWVMGTKPFEDRFR